MSPFTDWKLKHCVPVCLLCVGMAVALIGLVAHPPPSPQWRRWHAARVAGVQGMLDALTREHDAQAIAAVADLEPADARTPAFAFGYTEDRTVPAGELVYVSASTLAPRVELAFPDPDARARYALALVDPDGANLPRLRRTIEQTVGFQRLDEIVCERMRMWLLTTVRSLANERYQGDDLSEEELGRKASLLNCSALVLKDMVRFASAFFVCPARGSSCWLRPI